VSNENNRNLREDQVSSGPYSSVVQCECMAFCCLGGGRKVEAMAGEVMGNGKKVPDYIKECGAELSTMKNAQGLTLATYEWPAKTDKPRGVVFLVHGISVHLVYEFVQSVFFDGKEETFENLKTGLPKYENSWVERLNEEGFIVAGLDHQSYGLSEGARGLDHFYEEFEDLVKDAIQFRHQISEKYPELPVYIMGSSMGGCIATRVVEDDKDFECAGLMLIAPMLSIETIKKKPINKILLPISGVVSAVVPTVRVAPKAAHPQKVLRDHLASFELNEGQHHVRSRVAAQVNAAVEHVQSKFDLIKAPLLTIHSKHDTFTDPEGSQLIMDKCLSSDKTMKLLDDKRFWHMLPLEPGNSMVIDMIAEWISSR